MRLRRGARGAYTAGSQGHYSPEETAQRIAGIMRWNGAVRKVTHKRNHAWRQEHIQGVPIQWEAITTTRLKVYAMARTEQGAKHFLYKLGWGEDQIMEIHPYKPDGE